MALVDASSCPCAKSELELFSLPPTQTIINESNYVKYYPITALERGGPIEFKIITSDRDYIDPSHILLCTRNSIQNADGSAFARPTEAQPQIPNASRVFPINYFHATQFKQVEIYLNGKLVTSSNNLYAYKAYLEMLLCYDKQTKTEQLEMGCFYKQDENLDEHIQVAGNNASNSVHKRWDLSSYGKTFETVGRIHTELCNQGKLIPGNNEIRIRFHRNDVNFSLMGSQENHKYAINIDTAFLFVRHVVVSDSVREAHQLALERKHLKYPVRKIEMNFFTKGASRNDISETNLVTGVLPRKVIIGLVSSLAFSGSLHENPFNFQPFAIRNIILRKNGQSVPFEQIDVNVDDNLVMQGYMALLQSTGRLFKNSSMDITLENFKNGHTLFGFDIAPDESSGNNFELQEEGRLSLEIKLARALQNSVTIIVYLEYDAVIEIDKDRNVYYE